MNSFEVFSVFVFFVIVLGTVAETARFIRSKFDRVKRYADANKRIRDAVSAEIQSARDAVEYFWLEQRRYYREGGKLRHRRAWRRCPLCGERCCKPHVRAHSPVR